MSHITARLVRPLLLARGLIAACLVAAPTATLAAGGPADALKAYFDAFGRGDMAAVDAASAADESITDDIPPYQWHGPGALQAWLAADAQDAKTNGQTDMKASMGGTERLLVTGDTAYAVVRMQLTFRQNGQPMAEPARMVLTLADQDGAWKVTSWTWAGDAPKPPQP